MRTAAASISKAAGHMAGGTNNADLLRGNRQAAEAARTERAIRAQAEAILEGGEFEVEDGAMKNLMHIRYQGHKATVEGHLTPDGWDVRCTALSCSCTVPGEVFAQAVRLRLARNRAARADAKKPEIIKPCGGQPLAERAGASAVLGANAYAFEFTATSGEDVYGCYDARVPDTATHEQKYALETVAGLVTHCNCPDRVYRRRVCKHMVELAVALQTGLRTPGGAEVRAASVLSVLQAGPRTVADSLRALREDYHAAAARAVILTAAEVENCQEAAK